jgi:alpha-beta hydrolase superfamily lysophospholipase
MVYSSIFKGHVFAKADPTLPHFVYGVSTGAVLAAHYVIKHVNKDMRLDGIILVSPTIK